MEIRIKNNFCYNARMTWTKFSREIKINGELANMTKAIKAVKGSSQVYISDGDYDERHFTKCATIKNDVFLDALKRAYPFTCKAGKDHYAHKQICGVCLDFTDDDAFCVGADRPIIAKIRIDAGYTDPFRITIPNDFVRLLIVVLQSKKTDARCSINTDGETVGITGEGLNVVYSLKDGYQRYPNYKCLIPDTRERMCTFDVKAMEEAIDKIIAYSRSTGSDPVFEAIFGDYSVLCIYENREVDGDKPFVMDFTIPATSNDGDSVVNFDANLFHTVLASMKAKKCTIGVSGPLQATIFTSQEDLDSVFLLMPHYPKYETA